jgi:hypothetical protein
MALPEARAFPGDGPSPKRHPREMTVFINVDENKTEDDI